MQVSHKRPGELVQWSDNFGIKHCCLAEDKGVLSGITRSDISTSLGVRHETLLVRWSPEEKVLHLINFIKRCQCDACEIVHGTRSYHHFPKLHAHLRKLRFDLVISLSPMSRQRTYRLAVATLCFSSNHLKTSLLPSNTARTSFAILVSLGTPPFLPFSAAFKIQTIPCRVR